MCFKLGGGDEEGMRGENCVGYVEANIVSEIVGVACDKFVVRVI